MPLEKVYFIWVNRDKDAFEWFQSLLSTIEDSVPSSFLEIHVYMTGKLCVDDIQNIVLNSGSGVDPLTELQNKSHYGRPYVFNCFEFIGTTRASSNQWLQEMQNNMINSTSEYSFAGLVRWQKL